MKLGSPGRESKVPAREDKVQLPDHKEGLFPTNEEWITSFTTTTYSRPVNAETPSNLAVAAVSSTKWQNVTFPNELIPMILIIH